MAVTVSAVVRLFGVVKHVHRFYSQVTMLVTFSFSFDGSVGHFSYYFGTFTAVYSMSYTYYFSIYSGFFTGSGVLLVCFTFRPGISAAFKIFSASAF